jgi:hypothetical protein
VQCVDAETLAAWADGGLSKAEADAVELHMSACDRCTAMLATLVRATPEPQVAESLWQRWQLRWLVPVATAATVAGLWVLIPRSQNIATTPERAATEQVQPQAQTPQTPAPASDSAFARQSAPAAAAEPRAEESEEAEKRLAARDERRADAKAAPEPTPEAFAPGAPAREADQRTADRQSGRAAPSAPAEVIGEAARRAAPAPPAATSAAGNAELRRERSIQTFSAAPATAQFEVVSPDPMTRWRALGLGRVERSTSGGAQWEPATMPESATLTGGSSPSPSICWLVGRTGAVYVTTDGLRFARVPFPERTDFVAIQAMDGRRATVSTIDGRTFRTEDQGATWVRITP